jgi:hypothetical protein
MIPLIETYFDIPAPTNAVSIMLLFITSNTPTILSTYLKFSVCLLLSQILDSSYPDCVFAISAMIV